MEKGAFDERYKKENDFWGDKPAKAVNLLLDLKKSDTVLDLGVGQGRNALFLAGNGFNVTGVDISPEGVNQFINTAKTRGLIVKGTVCDIRDYEYPQDFDVIMSIATLPFLKKEEIAPVIQNMKQHTNRGGINLITVFTEDDPASKKMTRLYYFKKNELKQFYDDWDIVRYNEFTTPPEKHGENGVLHTHAIAVIIARKRF